MKKGVYITIIALSTALLTASGYSCRKGQSAFLTASAQKIYQRNWEDVWQATVYVLKEDLKMTLHLSEADAGIIQTKWEEYERAPVHFRDAADLEHHSRRIVAQYKITVMVKKTIEGTIVRIKKNEREFREQWVNVPTDLSVEREVLERITYRLTQIDQGELPVATAEVGLARPEDEPERPDVEPEEPPVIELEPPEPVEDTPVEEPLPPEDDSGPPVKFLGND